MIFYTDNVKDIKIIPEEYAIINISSRQLGFPNVINAFDLIPKDLTGDKKTIKRKYVKQLKDNEEFIVSYILMDRQNSGCGIVIYSDINEFNILKLIKKFIKKYYGMVSFEFTNDITLDMIRESKISEEGIERYMLLLNKYNKKSE